jgi:tRNA(fMet)-specific endonuclease VapC
MIFFLDTSILVDILRTKGPQNSFDLFSIIKDGNTGYISIITIAELSAGAYRSTRQDAIQKTNELITHFKVINLDEKIAAGAGKIYAELQNSGKEIELPDCMIAATAQVSGFNVIVTRNIDHFSRITNFSAVTPEQIIDSSSKKS